MPITDQEAHAIAREIKQIAAERFGLADGAPVPTVVMALRTDPIAAARVDIHAGRRGLTRSKALRDIVDAGLDVLETAGAARVDALASRRAEPRGAILRAIVEAGLDAIEGGASERD